MNLAAVGRLGLLQQQFQQVLVPTAVIRELKLSESYPGNGEISRALEAGWLVTSEVENQPLVAALQRDLDGGEAEAIALALHIGADVLLIDERAGRQRAKDFGLTVTGVIGVLLRARAKGQLPSLSDAIQTLREEAGFWISKDLETRILADVDDEPT